ncbi:hypothetical protein KIK06_09890 [Nocardiopsis sp. EMB25]|uniref:hypothetical protein n=1 Tax=Nocardiopsis sp. EMB25 TaxID=2835867 RepID=UPI0022845A66|nr:hypothetical protein [Nocardiopsis sp. EMB25]MCY9784203.1 hypothetical protein [Nocardiopsis sp. EMB25]
MFRSRKRRNTPSNNRTFDRTCSARVESADSGLYFDAHLSYGWTVTDGAEQRILHPDEVARSLLVGAVRAATAKHPVLHFQEAEWAANAELSDEIDDGGRITVSGRVRLGIPAATEARARARYRASEQVRLEEEEQTARLEVLRERVLSQGLGLVWWLDRHQGPEGGASPKQWVGELIDSYQELASALRRDLLSPETEERALLRARVEEALTLAEDPETAKRFAYYLEEYMSLVAGRRPQP